MKIFYALMLIGVLFSCKKNECCDDFPDNSFSIKVKNSDGVDLLDTNIVENIYNDNIRLYRVLNGDTTMINYANYHIGTYGYSLEKINDEFYLIIGVTPPKGVLIDELVIVWNDELKDELRLTYEYVDEYLKLILIECNDEKMWGVGSRVSSIGISFELTK